MSTLSGTFVEQFLLASHPAADLLPIASSFAERHALYADYENYLRGELRSWAESILFDRRTLDRGIFSPVFKVINLT